MNLQDKMANAVNNYINLSVVLTSDLKKMSDNEIEDVSWKRNYLRVISSLIEGESYCLKQICAIGMELDPTIVTSKEKKALTSGIGFTAIEQIKLILRITYKMFNLDNPPDFSGSEWEKAISMFNKRHSLMHPKVPDDLEITDDNWPYLREGANWLIHQHFDITQQIYEKYVIKSS
jgi:hypothetical protein